MTVGGMGFIPERLLMMMMMMMVPEVKGQHILVAEDSGKRLGEVVRCRPAASKEIGITPGVRDATL